ncbi:MAG: glycerol-3-phosphate dehydrogenase/oxidase [Gammaproteobacteria bacterium]|nr:glycerol-3-phosphate dehydrogenase/oxidase [Gammaproteobacteria bacterium]
MIQRDLSALADGHFDLVVVGGGIFGLCTAWDAALRGLSVALVERDDFGGATSGQCFKMVHGGIRYLQHADIWRLRQSARERSILLRIAPNQVAPLPILVPTYGHGTRGKAFLAAGVTAYDWLTADRNRHLSDPARRIPGGRYLSRGDTLARYPGLEDPQLTGSAVFCDGQMHSPQRLALAFLQSACDRGLVAANHLEATGFDAQAGRARGVEVRDRIGGESFTIQADCVVNAAGPWAEPLLRKGLGKELARPSVFSRDTCFVVRRRPGSEEALAVSARTRDPDALFSRSARHLFLVPWRQHTLVGVWHGVYQGDRDQVRVAESELENYLAEVNWAYPALELRREDISMWQAGLVLFGENAPGAEHLSFGKRSRLVDHGREHGIRGLFTLVGVRYTTARAEAVRVVDRVVGELGRALGPSRTHEVRLRGGEIDDMQGFLAGHQQQLADRFGNDGVANLVRNYGSDIAGVLACADEAGDQRLDGSEVLRAEVLHAVRVERACRLEDVVFNRTTLATAEPCSEAALQDAAGIMSAELGWDPARRSEELERTRARVQWHATGGTV